MPDSGEIDHAAVAEDQPGFSPALSRRWKDSQENVRVRRMAYACVALALVPTCIALSLLWLRQVELARQVTATDTTTVNISDSINSWNNQITDLRAQISSDQADLSLNAGSIAASADYADTLDKDISSIEGEIAADQKSLSQAEAQLSQAQQAHTDAYTRLDDMTGVWFVGVAGALAWIALVGLAYRLFREEKRRVYEDGLLLAELATPVEEDDPFDLHVMWKANREQLKTYHKLVLNYASSTRQSTIITLVVGFVLLVAVASIGVFSRNVPSAIASSVVAAAGTALTGFIANAVLRNADASSKEVLTFFAHPIEVERTLTAERIISEMPETARDTARLLIVQSLMNQTKPREDEDKDSPSVSGPEN